MDWKRTLPSSSTSVVIRLTSSMCAQSITRGPLPLPRCTAITLWLTSVRTSSQKGAKAPANASATGASCPLVPGTVVIPERNLR